MSSPQMPTPVTPEKLPAQQVTRNRLKLIAIMAVFALPVLIAYSGFFGGWFSDIHRTNKGELLTPAQAVADYHLAFESGDGFATGERWWLLLAGSEAECNAACELQLYTLQQTWISLGKNQERVKTAVLVSEWSAVPNEKLPNVTVKLRAGLNAHPDNGFYIVDPLGNVILRYALPTTQQEAIDRAKDMRTDFAKLLRFSRVG